MTLPKPYYETPLGKLYHGDCLEIMPHLEPVDLVLTDPPYGKKWARGKNAFGSKVELACDKNSLEWDKLLSVEHIDLIIKKSSNQIIWGGNYYFDFLKSTNCFLIWDKTGGLESTPMSDCEFAWTSFNTVARIYKIMNRGFVNEIHEKRYHPTQKPLKLFLQVINNYSEDGDLIADPFLGSGTTAIACERLKRRWIGIEIEEKYCEIAKKRIEQERKQRNLF